MMRKQFDAQLEELHNELILMGSLIEEAIAGAVRALVKQDKEMARSVIAFDSRIDAKEKEIEALCLRIILQRHPVAGDLRTISSALKIITDMERIGDQAADISEIALHLAGSPYIKKLERISMMADRTARMVTGAVDAFVKRDLAKVQEVVETDDVVDRLFTAVKDDLVVLIAEDISHGSQAMDLLMVAKYFERIGDHAENIAEWVEYAITGTHRRNLLG